MDDPKFVWDPNQCVQCISNVPEEIKLNHVIEICLTVEFTDISDIMVLANTTEHKCDKIDFGFKK